MHSPVASTAEVMSWKILVISALPSVTWGSIFVGMPRISGETVYDFRWQAPRFEVA